VSQSGNLYVGLIEEAVLRHVEMAEPVMALASGGDNVLVVDAGAILTTMAIEK